MDYIKGNKLAWEENFKNRKEGWGDDNYLKLKDEKLAFFNEDVRARLQDMDFSGKSIVQFCCNNGRELLSLMGGGLGVKFAVGFDIAENIIEQARDTAAKTGIENCEFVACNILEIPSEYHGKFDVVLLTAGALCWFENLQPLFKVAAKCLRPDGGTLIMHEIHPFEGMVAMPGEDGFDKHNLNKFTYSYFRSEPWVENSGMAYMSEKHISKTFTSFSHSMSAIINALSISGLKTAKLDEFDYAISGTTDIYDKKGLPLSFFLIAEK